MALELGQQQGQYMVGGATPTMEQPQNTGESGRAAFIEGLMRSSLPAVKSALSTVRANEAVRGALDATTTMNALEQKDERVKQQNMFFREAYEEGYVSAALNKDMTDFRDSNNDQVRRAVEDGMALEDFDQLMRERNETYASRIAQHLPHIPKEQAAALLGDLQETSLSTRNKFIKDSAAVATMRADRALDSNLNAVGNEFYQFVGSGELNSAQGSIAKGLRAINVSGHLDKKAKVERAKQFMRGVAMQTDEPELIDMMQHVVGVEMGVTLAPEVNAALFNEWKRAGSQNEAKVTAELEAAMGSLEALPADQQKQAADGIRDSLEVQAQRGVISAGTMRGYLTRLQTQAKAGRTKYAVTTSIEKFQPVAAIAAASGMTQEKAQAELLKHPQFANTTQGNLQLLRYAEKSNDSGLAELALNRASANAGALLSTLDFTGKDGAVSADAEQNVAAWMGLYNTASSIGKQTLVAGLPERFRGVMQSAAVTDPQNVGALFDNLRRIAENEASGKYQNLSMTMPQEAVKDVADKFSNWFSFGSTSDAQRARGMEAVQQSWRQLALRSPELMADPDTAKKNAVADAMARRVELELNGKAVHSYVPVGRKLSDFYGAYSGSAEQFTKSLQETVQSYISTIPKENVDDIVVELGSAGGDAMGASISVFKDGIRSQVYAVSGSTIQEKAIADLDAQIQTAAQNGEKMMGLAPATFANHTNNRVMSTNVSGVNKVGMDPTVFADITSNTMRFEGFVGKRTKDTVGFGRHKNSGLPIPDEVSLDDAVVMLQSDLESKYIPTARRAAADAGIKLDDDIAPVLVDLSYHGGYGASSEVAKAMKAAQGMAGVPFDAKRRSVLNALQETAAYKQSQPERKQYLERGLNTWAQTNLM